MKTLIKVSALAAVMFFSSFAVAADFNPDPGVYMKDSTFKAKVRVDGKVEAVCEGLFCKANAPIGSIDAKGGVVMINSEFEADVEAKDVVARCNGMGCAVSAPVASIIAGR